MDVLDLACGHGRIANRLASRGARVVGLDATALFLSLAREKARERPSANGSERMSLIAVELRDWLLDAGFSAVAFFDHGGEPLSVRSPRMVTIARC